MILGQLGLDIGPAVAGLGVVGIAVGFGAQFLVRDYLNGALILIENQFARATSSASPGSRARSRTSPCAGRRCATSTASSTRCPNGEIKVASNLTRVWARINQDVTVAYGTDIDTAIEVVDEVGREMAADPVWQRRVLEAPRVERVAGARPRSGVTLKILGTVRAADQWAAAGDFRKRLLEAFRKQRHRDRRGRSGSSSTRADDADRGRGPADRTTSPTDSRTEPPDDRRASRHARGRMAGPARRPRIEEPT